MARPAAYMVCGVLMWTMLFLVGLGFPFLLVGMPLPPGGPSLGFVPVSMRSPVGGLHPRRLRLKGRGAYLSKEDQVPHQDLLWGLQSGG